MAQIQDGTASVTSGSAAVIGGAQNDWSAAKLAITRGTPVWFSLSGATEIPRQVLNVIDPATPSPSGFWELTLVSPWVGDTLADQPYIIHKDFTNNIGLPIFSPGDSQTAQIMARMVEILDTAAPYSDKIVKLTADMAGTSGSTLLNLTDPVTAVDIKFALKSTLYYEFECYLAWSSSATSAGAKLGLICPATTLICGTVRIPATTTDGTDAEVTGPIIGTGGSVGAATAKAATTIYVARLHGIICPSADGVLQFQYASGGTGTITPKAGTFARLRPL